MGSSTDIWKEGDELVTEPEQNKLQLLFRIYHDAGSKAVESCNVRGIHCLSLEKSHRLHFRLSCTPAGSMPNIQRESGAFGENVDQAALGAKGQTAGGQAWYILQ
jgi:hypothetical protein